VKTERKSFLGRGLCPLPEGARPSGGNVNKKVSGKPHPLFLVGEEAKDYNGLYPFPWEGETNSEPAFPA
jgi:hypothetical protein